MFDKLSIYIFVSMSIDVAGEKGTRSTSTRFTKKKNILTIGQYRCTRRFFLNNPNFGQRVSKLFICFYYFENICVQNSLGVL